MHYIVGLGNPGDEHKNTRHNIGWILLDFVTNEAGLPKAIINKSMSGKTTSGTIAGIPVSLLYPDTYMNNSGSAVSKFVPQAELERLIVIHDDIDLVFGEIKLGKGRGDGGNNGVRSIIEKVDTKNFIRIRVGIAPRSFWTGKVKRPKGGGPLELFVLKPFSKREEIELQKIKERTYAALHMILVDGLEKAMNNFN